MVAVFHPESLLPDTLLPDRGRATAGRGATRSARPDRPQLRVIEGGVGAVRRPAAEATANLRAFAVVGVLLLGGFLGLRTVRTSGMAAAGSAGPAVVAEMSVGQGESIYVVRPGDTLWSIAAGLVPGEDPRPLVEELSRRNGGTAIAAGQRLVVPN